MDPMTLMMIASAASSLLGGGKKEEQQQPQNSLANPFQQKQQMPLMGFPSMQKDYLSAVRRMSRGG